MKTIATLLLATFALAGCATRLLPDDAGSLPADAALDATPDQTTTFCASAAHCSDGIKNCDETNVDCGGAACTSCGNCSCKFDSDCIMGNVCSGCFCFEPSCTDGRRDGKESDVDCGGTVCPRCGTGKKCLTTNDCASGRCPNGTCG